MIKTDQKQGINILTLDGYFDKQTSLFKNGKSTLTPSFFEIKRILNNIQNGYYETKVSEYRNIIDKEKQSDYKSTHVPAFTLSIKCKNRSSNFEKKDKIISYTGILQCDIDNKNGEQSLQMKEIRNILEQDKHILFCFDSISGNGIKAGFVVSGWENLTGNDLLVSFHESAFNQMEQYFKDKNISVDSQVKSIMAICYISDDSELYLNNKATPFKVIPEPKKQIQSIKATSTPTPSGTHKITDNNKDIERMFNKWVDNIPSEIEKKFLDHATDGERHSTRLRIAKLAGGYVAGGLVSESVIMDVIRRNSDTVSNTGETSKKEITAIKNGFTEGLKQPITVEQKKKEFAEYIRRNKTADSFSIDINTGEILENIEPEQKTGEPDEVITDEFIWHCLNSDESGDGEMVERIYKDKRLFDHDENEWYKYENGIWCRDSKKEFMIEVGLRLIQIYSKLLNNVSEQIKQMNLKLIQDDSDTQIINAINKLKKNEKTILNRINKLNTIGRLNHVLEFASKRLTCVTAEFDSYKMLLNLKNGTFDLQSMKFREHRPADKLRKLSGTSYSQTAKCKYWIDFLNKIFDNDSDIITFIQQLCGVWLTGTTDLQHIVFAYGSGANGKSVFFNTIQMLLNGFDSSGNKIDTGLYKRIPINALLYDNNKSSTTDYYTASLHGVRLAVASEIPKNKRLNESLVKDLTGGEVVNGRHIYGRPFEFYPTHKLCIVGNSKPDVKDTSDGFWRRMLLIPFEVTIPEQERRPQSVLEKEFKSELSGILNWCLDGWNSYQKNGLNVPDKVKMATKEYQKESDVLSEFLDDIKNEYDINKYDKSLSVKAEIFYKCYCDWCSADTTERINPFTNNKQFNKNIRELGHTVKFGTGNKTFIYGIGLKNSKLDFANS